MKKLLYALVAVVLLLFAAGAVAWQVKGEAWRAEYAAYRKTGAPILMYHAVGTEYGPEWPKSLIMPPQLFEEHLRYLKEQADRYVAREPLFANLVERYVPSYPVRELLLALGNVMRDTGRPLAYIEPQAFSVQEKMADILQRLQVHPDGFLLNDLLQTAKSGEKVAAFLGVLELLKMGLITIAQHAAFAPIYIFSKQGEASHVS